MTRVVVLAGRGRGLATATAAVSTLPGACEVRHACAHTHLDRLVARIAPDLVVMGDMPAAAQALARLAEIRRAAPAARVVVVSADPEARWLADALRAHAAAVVPGAVDARALGVVLRELLAEPTDAVPVPAGARQAHPARPAGAPGSTPAPRSVRAGSLVAPGGRRSRRRIAASSRKESNR